MCDVISIYYAIVLCRKPLIKLRDVGRVYLTKHKIKSSDTNEKNNIVIMEFEAKRKKYTRMSQQNY